MKAREVGKRMKVREIMKVMMVMTVRGMREVVIAGGVGTSRRRSGGRGRW